MHNYRIDLVAVQALPHSETRLIGPNGSCLELAHSDTSLVLDTPGGSESFVLLEAGVLCMKFHGLQHLINQLLHNNSQARFVVWWWQMHVMLDRTGRHIYFSDYNNDVCCGSDSNIFTISDIWIWWLVYKYLKITVCWHKCFKWCYLLCSCIGHWSAVILLL
jgi:hypothetical protein